MCGLVGIAGKLEYADEDVMRRLLMLDYWRGKDSTGLAAVRTSDKSIMISKLASHPLDLFEMGKFKTVLSASQSQAFIGHNRAATKGLINTFNAHPFQYDHIVGAHNGTLSVQSHRELEDKLGERFGVDSQAIIKAIAVLGLEETIPLLQGAWAITYYDANENTLNFIRNDQRPLWYSYSKDFKKLIWASEYQFIDEAARAGKIELAPLTNERGTFRFFATEIDYHYRFDLAELRDGPAQGETEKTRPKPKVKELKGKEAPAAANQSWQDDPFPSPHRFSQSASGTTTSTTSTGKHISTRIKRRTEDNVANAIVSLIGSPSDPYAGMIKREDFEYMSKYGCSWCQATVQWGDVGITIYERDQLCLCADCSRVDKGGQNRIFVPNIKMYQ